MASVVLTSGVVVGNQSLVTNGAYTSYDLTKSGSFPAAGYRVASATLRCTLRNAVWDTITVKAADGTTLGSFGAVGTNGERTCALITGYDYASLTHVTLYGGGVGTQIAGGSYVTITVEWAYTTSALTLSAASVDAGGTVTASIGAYDPAFSHQVRLEFGTKAQTWDVAAGVTAQAVDVPVAWLDQIPTARSGPARVTLITYSAGVYVGAVAASLTVTVPASAAPTFSASCAPLLTVGGTTYPSMGDGVYVQSKSGCTAKITGAAAQYGATVTGYNIRGGGYSGTSATLQTGLLGGSGTVPFVFRVTDSRGMYTEKTVNLTVLAYTAPQVSSLTGWRVDSGGGSRARGHPGQVPGGMELHQPGRGQHLHGEGVYQARRGQRNGPERGHGQRRGLLGGHRGGKHHPGGDHAIRAAPGADRQVWHGIGDGQPALGGLCHASERGGKQYCLRKGLRKKQRGGDCRGADAVPGGQHSGGLHPGAGQNDHGAGLDTEHVFSGGGHLSILRGHVPGVAVWGDMDADREPLSGGRGQQLCGGSNWWRSYS